MKDLLNIYRRYILAAVSISLLILLFNLILFFIFQASQFHYKMSSKYTSYQIESLAGALSTDGSLHYLSPEASEAIDEYYAFAMLISQKGQVIWSRNLPEEIPLSYSLTDIASMTRWYLKDYAVKTWTHPDGLFVVAAPKGSRWKHSIEFPISFIEALPAAVGAIFLGNLLLALLLAVLFGRRFYVSLRVLADGIEALAKQEPVVLPEKGMTASLAGKLNQTAAILEKQSQILQKRDNARTSWIAGVSHDIRTPLSLIMGHADNLEQSPGLNPEEQKEAASIKENSLHIKKLIEDLNLTSKLEYDSYPLRLNPYSPASLLRTLAAWYMNNGLDERYHLTLDIDASLEGVTLTGDADLLMRAFRNLTDNSIRHNPKGCILRIDARLLPGRAQISFSDTGKGIPIQIVKALYRPNLPAASGTGAAWAAPHIMGLRIVKQIVEAHRGTLKFELQKDICRTAVILLPAKTTPPE